MNTIGRARTRTGADVADDALSRCISQKQYSGGVLVGTHAYRGRRQ